MREIRTYGLKGVLSSTSALSRGTQPRDFFDSRGFLDFLNGQLSLASSKTRGSTLSATVRQGSPALQKGQKSSSGNGAGVSPRLRTTNAYPRGPVYSSFARAWPCRCRIHGCARPAGVRALGPLPGRGE